jgi:hypothetical protein
MNKIFSFSSYEEAQGAIWDQGGWVTSKSGRRGSTKTRSYHGGEKGKYKITCDKNGDGTAYLWAATTNDTSFSVDDLDGAQELEDEGEEEDEEEEQDDELLEELDTVIVAAGKTVDQIKMMHFLSWRSRSTLKPATRTAPSLRHRSTSWRPSGAARPSTKPSTRSWAGCSSTSCRHENACKCIRMCTNAYEYMRMHRNARECIRLHLRTQVNACASECI